MLRRKVLVVDDNSTDRSALSGILGKEYMVTEAENGKEAYSMLLGSPYSFAAVITDVMMPVMDGHELVTKIRQSGFMNQIPIIAVTSDTDEESMTKALSCGANNFIAKPVNFTLLLTMVKNCVRLRESASIVNELQRDKLTGIYNREAFMREVTRLLRRSEPGYYTILSFDITHFKGINDQYGQEMGNKVLKHIAAAFHDGFNPIGGVCCHIVDDRFAALYPASYQNSTELENVWAQCSDVEGLSSPLLFSVGCYNITDLSLTPSAMYDRAVLACETIKGSFEEKFAFYNDSLRLNLLHEQKIVSDMQHALRMGEFEPWFQPQYNHFTGALIGAEVLIRWRRKGKIVPPIEFIPLFEKNGFIYEVDQFIWKRVCALLRRWMDEGKIPLPVSVNVSRVDLIQKNFLEVICALVNGYNLPVDMLRLEITESAFSDASNTVNKVVNELISLGFIVEIDDFGSGYSSLNTLKDIPASILKLDMRFFENTVNSQRSGNIVESVVRMAKWLGMSVIAEGVEEREQADFLKTIGCYYIQGYYYAKPMPVSDYEKLFDNEPKERRMVRLETLTALDNNEFWNPKSMDTLIFNSYVGAACILEFSKGSIEILRVTDRFIKMLGCSAPSVEDLLRTDWAAYLNTYDLCRFSDAVAESKETLDTVYGEYEFTDLPGRSGRIVLRAEVRVIAASGDRWLIYCICENITSQREAARIEKRLLAEMQAMMADMPGGFVRIQVMPDGRYVGTYCNVGFSKLVGMDYDRIIHDYSSNPLAHVHPDDVDVVRKAVAEMLKNGEAHSSRYRILHANGNYVWVTVFGRFTQDQNGNSYLNLYYTDETQHDKEAKGALLGET